MANTARIVVIGGGASGMLAAITAAQTIQKQKKAGRIVLLEKENRVGKKLLATGNGRCNLSNQEMEPAHFHGGRDWAAPLLQQFPAKAIVQCFEKMGLLCRTDSEGRVYPYNLQASAVLEILRMQLELYGVEVFCEQSVESIRKKGEQFCLTAENGEQWLAEKVILAAGGKAAPKLGGSGSGTRLAKQLGHTIVQEFPALVQLKSDPNRMKAIKGMRSQCRASLYINGKQTLEETGEVQFTEHGLSGICIFQFSGSANQQMAQGAKVEAALDLMPEWKTDQLVKRIAGQGKRYADLPALDLLCGFVNQRVGQAVIKEALGKQIPSRAGDCTYDQYQKIAETVKAFRFPITGSMGWDSAQVTAGGVDCREIDNHTMESKKCRGLYLTGELIDLYGDCGGFNLHFAWSSGIAAGRDCAGALQEERA